MKEIAQYMLRKFCDLIVAATILVINIHTSGLMRTVIFLKSTLAFEDKDRDVDEKRIYYRFLKIN